VVETCLLLKQAGPTLLKEVPKLWPLLLDKKVREQLIAAARNAAAQSPDKRLRGRLDGTVAVARGIAEGASDTAEQAIAQGWASRAVNLTLALDLPVDGQRNRAARRKIVKEKLAALLREMEEHLQDRER
jgi:hypothetical protein